jgi:hypothetical protein
MPVITEFNIYHHKVWGFELIGGQRYFTRRMVIVNSAGQYEMGRLVYNFHDD